jgi:membrane protein implicated in regulation of membrane protease activity
MGQESLIGKFGTVRKAIPRAGSGQVQVASELWTAELAEGEAPMPQGTKVEVVAVHGVRLRVAAREKDHKGNE